MISSTQLDRISLSFFSLLDYGHLFGAFLFGFAAIFWSSTGTRTSSGPMELRSADRLSCLNTDVSYQLVRLASQLEDRMVFDGLAAIEGKLVGGWLLRKLTGSIKFRFLTVYLMQTQLFGIYLILNIVLILINLSTWFIYHFSLLPRHTQSLFNLIEM